MMIFILDPRKRSIEISKLKADIPELDEVESHIRTLSKHDENESYENSFNDIIKFLSSLIKLETALLNPEISRLHKEQLEELKLDERIKNSINLSNAIYIKYKIILQKKEREIGSSINTLTAFIFVLTVLLIKFEVASRNGTKEILLYNQHIGLGSWFIDILFTLGVIYILRSWIFFLIGFIWKSIPNNHKMLAYIREGKDNIIAILLMGIAFLIIFIIPVCILLLIFKK